MEFASGNWYDTWFPNLAPSVETMKIGQAASSDKEWAGFIKAYKAEMSVPDRKHDIVLLAALSQTANFSVAATANTRIGVIDRRFENYWMRPAQNSNNSTGTITSNQSLNRTLAAGRNLSSQEMK